MPTSKKAVQTNEANVLTLVKMAIAEIESGKAKYVTFEEGKAAELFQVKSWIIAHSPVWRSKGHEMLLKEMKRLRLDQ